jgi:hypothetical protein
LGTKQARGLRAIYVPGLKLLFILRGAFAARLKEATEKVVAQPRSPSGAEARIHFQRLSGTNEFVPFPSLPELEFFRSG